MIVSKAITVSMLHSFYKKSPVGGQVGGRGDDSEIDPKSFSVAAGGLANKAIDWMGKQLGRSGPQGWFLSTSH